MGRAQRNPTNSYKYKTMSHLLIINKNIHRKQLHTILVVPLLALSCIRSWSYCYFMVLIVAIFLMPVLGNASPSKPDDDCVECHQSLWDREISKQYIHPPFLKKQCRKCHIDDDNAVSAARGFMSDADVNWLAGSRLNTNSHWFSVPHDKIDGDLLVDLQEPGHLCYRKKIKIPQFSKIRQLPNDHQPPKISGVKVVDLARGLFLHATLVWHTDKEASSQVIYGIRKMNKKTKLDSNLGTDHLVIVAGLRAGKTYTFRVVSHDLFGNVGHSDISFTTARSKIHKKKFTEKKNRKPAEKISIKYRLYRNKDNILLKFKTNKPVFVGIGTKKKQQIPRNDIMKTRGPAPAKHNLKDLVSTTNKVCEQCHGKYVAKKNHPINIPISPGMAMPKDFFVLNNGDITCMTCHAAHASNFEYRLVRSSKRELCISCHLAKM